MKIQKRNLLYTIAQHVSLLLSAFPNWEYAVNYILERMSYIKTINFMKLFFVMVLLCKH